MSHAFPSGFMEVKVVVVDVPQAQEYMVVEGGRVDGFGVQVTEVAVVAQAEN
jgi:hypothetical protein